MTTVLAIDTSSSPCAAGLAHAGEFFTRTSVSPRHGAQEILALVENVRTEAGIELAAIEGIIALTGPGSFTGLRIGIGAAQGLSESLAIPATGVSTLAFQAWMAAREQPLRHWLVAQPGRENEVYFGAYRIDPDSGIEQHGTEQLGSLDSLCWQFLQGLEECAWGAVGDGWGDFSSTRQHLPVPASFCAIGRDDSIEEQCRLGILMLKRTPTKSAENLDRTPTKNLDKTPTTSSGNEVLLPNYVQEQMDYS